MLTLRLHKFRCWRSLELTFLPEKVYLLQGESGAGKSTVARAISWVLYGAPKDVTPTLEPKADTTVEFIVPNQDRNLRIIRQRPNNLWVIVTANNESTTYEGPGGQAIINDLFGTQELWQATAHLDPRGDNAFMRQSNVTKMNLLTAISFVDMDPISIIEKLDPYLIKLTAEYQVQLNVFQSTLARYQVDHPNVNWECLLPPEQIVELHTQLSTTRAEYDQGLRLQTEYQVKWQQKQDLECRREQISLPLPATDLLVADINKLNEYLQHIRTCQRLQAQCINYQDLGYTKADLEAAQHATRLYQANVNLARSLNIGYTQEHIQTQIQSIQATLDAQSELVKLQELQYQGQTLTANLAVLQSRLDKIAQIKLPDIDPREVPLPDVSIYDNTQLQLEVEQLTAQRITLTEQLSKLKASRDILQCPRCQGSLRYQDQCLVMADSLPVNPEDLNHREQEIVVVNRNLAELSGRIRANASAVIELNRKYTETVHQERIRISQLVTQRNQAEKELNARAELEVQIKSLSEQYAEVSHKLAAVKPSPYPLLADRDINALRTRLQQCLQIQIVEPPAINPQVIEDFLHRQQRHREYQSLRDKYPELQDVGESRVVDDIQRLTKYQQEYQSALVTQKLIQQQLDALTLPIVPDVGTLNQQIVQLTHRLDLAEATQRAYYDYQQLVRVQTAVNDINTKLARTNVFKSWLIDRHAQILSPVLAEINRELNATVAHLFTQSITINLEMYRLTKTTKQLRQDVSFHIDYKGSISDGKGLSDGETDRVVIATNLSLFKATRSPLLILDESVKMVGIDLKEKALQVVRDINKDRYVIIIGHDLVEGQFDVVYNMESIGDNYEP